MENFQYILPEIFISILCCSNKKLITFFLFTSLKKNLNSIHRDFIVSIINAFFKRISWINFKHGDAKTSNFFVNKTLVAIDLDTSNKHYLDFFFIDNLSRDKKRMLKSLKGYNKIYSKLSKRLRRS